MMPLPAVIHWTSPAAMAPRFPMLSPCSTVPARTYVTITYVLAAIPHAVAMLDGPGKDVRDGLDAAMRMPRKARQIILGNIVTKIVEEKERVKVRGVAEAERAAQVHARAFHRWLGFDEPLHRSDRHSASSRESLPIGCKAA